MVHAYASGSDTRKSPWSLATITQENNKKAKSQSLISSPVSQSSSSTGRKSGVQSIMDDGKKRKKNSSRRSKKNTSPKRDIANNNNNIAVATEKSEEEVSTPVVSSESIPNSNSGSNDNKMEETLLSEKPSMEDDGEPITSSTLPTSSSSPSNNRRKSSGTHKDLRKDSVPSCETTVVVATHAELHKELEQIESQVSETKLDDGEGVPSVAIDEQCGSGDGRGNGQSVGSLLNDNVNVIRDQNEAYQARGISYMNGKDTPQPAEGAPSAFNVFQQTTLQQQDKVEDKNYFDEVDDTDDSDTACTESFRQLKPFNYDLEPVEEVNELLVD